MSVTRILLLLVISTSLVFPIHLQAQNRRTSATRIRFNRGELSATVAGRLSSRHLEQSFLVGARAGQELYIKAKAQSDDGLDFVTVLISDPSGKPIGANDGSDLRVTLKHTGDYRIVVSPPGSFYRQKIKGYKELRFSLFVKIG